MILRWQIFLFGAFAATVTSAANLPSDACVRQVRSARIDALRGESEAALARLREAVNACPDALAPLVALIDDGRRYGLGEENRQALLARLDERLADAGRPLVSGELGVIATRPGIDEDLLRRILPPLAARIAAMPDPDPGVLEALADLQERLGEHADAGATLERLYQLRPRRDTLWRLIKLYRRLERPADEAYCLAVLVEQSPVWRRDYIRALSRAGQMEELRRQIDAFAAETREEPDPVADFEAALEVNKLNARPFFFGGAAGLARILSQSAWNLYDRGNDAEAEALFREALAQNPKSKADDVLLNLFGTAEDRRRAAEERARRFEEVSDPQSLFEEGTRLLTAGDAEAAIDLLRRAAPQLPKLEPAWYNLGMAAYRLEDWETVATAFGQALELNPGRGPTYFFRGIALVQLERWTEALEALQLALELEPERALAHYYLSLCHSALGDSAAAAAAMERYKAGSEG